MEITKENFITARYIDNDKRQVEVLYKKGDETIEYVLQHDTSHPDWKHLMTITTIDKLHENTHTFIKKSQKDFREHVKRIAEAEGILNEVKAGLNTEFYKELYKFFYEYDDSKSKEELFNLKLHVFEKDLVKDSKDTETKANMRKAKTPLEFFNELSKLKV